MADIGHMIKSQTTTIPAVKFMPYLHSTEIPRASAMKYLGVTVDSKLKWNQHNANTVTKDNSTLGFICRNVTTSSQEVKSLAYKQLVRPVLEYASSAWDSAMPTTIDRVDTVQRRAA